MYKYIFFDLDGTLTDSAPGITRGVQYSLKKMGIEVEDLNELLVFIGPPLSESYPKYYHMTEEESNQAIAYFHEYYDDYGCFQNDPYPGVREMLEELISRGIRPVLATSKPLPTATKILEHFDLAKYFYYLGGGSFDEARNGKAEVIEDTLKAAGVEDKSEVLMVGDRLFDVNGAKANGLDSAGVLYGFGSKEEMESVQPTYIFENVQDILNFC